MIIYKIYKNKNDKLNYNLYYKNDKRNRLNDRFTDMYMGEYIYFILNGKYHRENNQYSCYDYYSMINSKYLNGKL